MRYLIFSLIMLSLLACNQKTYTTSVEGRVIDFGTKQPLAGYTVILNDGIGGTSILGMDQGGDYRAETVTDSNGYFKLAITGEWSPFLYVKSDGSSAYGGDIVIASNYFLNSSDPLFLPENKKISQLIIEYGQRVKCLFNLRPNQKPEANDELRFKVRFGTKYELEKFYKGQFYNDKVDFFGFFYKNQYVKYQLEFQRDGIWQVHKDSVLVNGIDTVHTIYF